MPQNVIYWGAAKQSHLCLSSGSIPRPRRNKPSSLLYDCVCVVSRPGDLAVPPVRSCIWPNRKCTKIKHNQGDFKSFVDLFLSCRGAAVPCVRFRRGPPDKGLLREVQEGAYFTQGCSFHLWSLVVNQFGLLAGWVKKAPFTGLQSGGGRCGSRPCQGGLPSLQRDANTGNKNTDPPQSHIIWR